MPCYSTLKAWWNEESGRVVFKGNEGNSTINLPCGQCLGCRLDRSRHWAIRCSHEASVWEFLGGNSFVTLTYRDKAAATDDQVSNGYFVPDDWSVSKRHFQLFMKRLRKAWPDKIRFFACGEYGRLCRHGVDVQKYECPFMCKTGRPHYHAILFNFQPPDCVKYKEERGFPHYESAMMNKLWPYGFVDVGGVTFQSCAYVARYVLKKVNGHHADDHYMVMSPDGEINYIEKEFVLMSRRPGIGAQWYDQYKSDLFPRDEVPVPGVGIVRGMPRYYMDKLKEENPYMYEEVKLERKKFFEKHGEEFTPEALMSKYKVKKAQVRMLKRTVA